MTQEPIVVGIDLIEITYGMAVWLVVIGFVGGLLSGFIGIGGAFIMTPAMMSMGIPGMVAVAAIVTHKFGKAIMGAKKQSEMGNVDIKLGLVMFAGLFAGVRAAFDVNQFILEKAGLAGPDQQLPRPVRVKHGLSNAGRKMHYYLNYSGVPHSFNYPYGAGEDILAGRPVEAGRQIALAPWDVVVIEER